MNLLDNLETFIRSSGVDGPVPIFKDTMQENPDLAVCIYEYQGGAPTAQIASVHRSIQIVVRGKRVSEVRGLIHDIYKVFDADDPIFHLTPARWCMIHLRDTPFKFKVDESNRNYYCFNMGITTTLN